MKLEIKNLTKKYGNYTALNNLNLTFEAGIYGILGENGAGKSTLMNLLTDNIKRDNGSILYNNKEILNMKEKYRELLGYMPQQQGFYENMTADTFLHYMAKLKGVEKKDIDNQINELLHITNLENVRHKKIKGFSGGMKQRVLLSQALLGNPKIVILDEPTAGLDPKERIKIRNFISSIARNKIILLATHIVSDIESISDKIILMKKGRLIDVNTTSELISDIKDKVREYEIDEKQLSIIQDKYKVSNIYIKNEKLVVRLVGDELPEGGKLVSEHLTLEEVYLYYLAE